ncbi:MAG: hypothetical protein HY820_45930 [Acidobacteria bacterium]|nr:hypothetical protein [Acidobacteriota bacterium]
MDNSTFAVTGEDTIAREMAVIKQDIAALRGFNSPARLNRIGLRLIWMEMLRRGNWDGYQAMSQMESAVDTPRLLKPINVWCPGCGKQIDPDVDRVIGGGSFKCRRCGKAFKAW